MTIPVRTETVRSNVPGGKGHSRGIIGAGQGIYEASSSPLHQVGDRLPLWGGRVFYYASFSDYEAATGDAAAGDLLAADTDFNDQTELDGKVEDSTNDSSNYDPAIGEKLVEIEGTATKDEYTNATLHITDDTGEGYTYLIKRNSATGVKLNQDDPALTGTDTFVVELYDGLVIALDNTTEIVIMGNLFANLLPCSEDTDTCAIGVAMLAIDVSDKRFAWVQTWGPATIVTTGTVTKGDILVLSDTTRMVQTMAADYTHPIVGYALAAPSSSGHCAVMLQLVP